MPPLSVRVSKRDFPGPEEAADYISAVITDSNTHADWVNDLSPNTVEDAEQAFIHLRNAVDAGDASDNVWLRYASCLKEGLGTPKDPHSAFPIFSKLAGEGHVAAQCNLGVCYDLGQGTEKDIGEAIKWYRQAAEQGAVEAQQNLGSLYYYQEQNTEKAVEWWRLAAEQGNVNALCNLAGVFYTGDGVEQDMSLAVEYWQNAAKRGHAASQFSLAQCYAYGYGVEQDLEEAVKLLTSLINQHSPPGLRQLYQEQANPTVKSPDFLYVRKAGSLLEDIFEGRLPPSKEEAAPAVPAA